MTDNSDYDIWRNAFLKSFDLCIDIVKFNELKSVTDLLLVVNQENSNKFIQNGARCGLDYFRHFGYDDTTIKFINNYSWLNIRFKYANCITSDITDIITHKDLYKLLDMVKNNPF